MDAWVPKEILDSYVSHAAPLGRSGKPPERQKIKKALELRGFYEQQKQKYADKIIDYPDSPTSKAYIGINKLPLMPLEDGYGFKGVLVQDETRKFIQCASCGKWTQKLNAAHLERCGGLTVAQYKEKYGLNKSCGLISDELSYRRTRWLMETARGKKFIERVREMKGKAGNKPISNGKTSAQSQNEAGLCPAQIKARLVEFVHTNRELPSQYNRGRLIAQALKRRYGTLGKGLRAFGLPYRERFEVKAKKFHFPDGSVRRFDITEMGQREAFYQTMVEKCPILL